MSYRFHLERFEGPLDLLLQLIEEQKLDITNVALASVTEQFLRYLQQHEDLHPEELADFLVVAAKLLLIKSRAILPSLAVDEDDGIDLEKQLKLYREYYEASKRIAAMIAKRQYTFSRSSSLRVAVTERRFRPPEHVRVEHLRALFVTVLRRLEPFVTIPEETIVRTVNIREKLEAIRQRIVRETTIQFHTLIQEAPSRTDIIVTFLALLELVKQRTIDVLQQETFSSIVIHRRVPSSAPVTETENHVYTQTAP